MLLWKALRPSHHLLDEYTPQEYDGDNNNNNTTFEGLCVTNSNFLIQSSKISQLNSHYILGSWNSIISPEEYQCLLKPKLMNIFDLEV